MDITNNLKIYECDKCRTEVSADALICPQCGNDLSETIEGIKEHKEGSYKKNDKIVTGGTNVDLATGEDLSYLLAWLLTVMPLITIVFVLTNWFKQGRRKIAIQAIITPLASYFIWFLLAGMASGPQYSLTGSIGILMIFTPIVIHYFVIRYLFL